MGHQHRTGCTTEECLKRGQKPAPVDTTRLKMRIKANEHKVPYLESAASAIPNKTIRNSLDRNKLYRKAEAASVELNSQRDTLDKARKGKIKAK